MKREGKTFRDNNMEACLTTKSTEKLTGGIDTSKIGREMTIIQKTIEQLSRMISERSERARCKLLSHKNS